MGIYPQLSEVTAEDGTLLKLTWTPEGTRYQVFAPTHDIFIRENCYCCSCDDADAYTATRDPFCRNHGWAGTRRCTTHNMPGDETYEDGSRIMSVEEKRAYDERVRTS